MLLSRQVTRDHPQVESERAFFSLVRAAFSSRRKMLRNNLRPHNSVEQVEAALVSLGLPATARPQELTLAEFLGVYGILGGPWNEEQAAPRRVRLAKAREQEGAEYAAGDDEGEGGEAGSSSDGESDGEGGGGEGVGAGAAKAQTEAAAGGGAAKSGAATGTNGGRSAVGGEGRGAGGKRPSSWGPKGRGA